MPGRLLALLLVSCSGANVPAFLRDEGPPTASLCPQDGFQRVGATCEALDGVRFPQCDAGGDGG